MRPSNDTSLYRKAGSRFIPLKGVVAPTLELHQLASVGYHWSHIDLDLIKNSSEFGPQRSEELIRARTDLGNLAQDSPTHGSGTGCRSQLTSKPERAFPTGSQRIGLRPRVPSEDFVTIRIEFA
jgi:hypothetical protein